MTTLTTLPDAPFARRDLPALGMTPAALRTALAAGEVRRVVPGAYTPAHLPDTLEVRLAAAALVLPAHQVATDRTAAAIHGVDVYTWAEHDLGLAIEVCALRGNEPSRRSGIDGHTRDLRDDDIMEIDGVRLTTPLRTALDLGCNLHRRDAFAAINGLAALHDLTLEQLVIGSFSFRGRRGVRQLRALLPHLEPAVESLRESWTLLEIIDAGLPRPVVQHWVHVDGVPTYRLDLAWPKVRVCVEYDGFDAHAADVEQVEHDERRRRWLREIGWTVVVVRVGDFSGRRRDRWLREVRDALRRSYSNRRF